MHGDKQDLPSTVDVPHTHRPGRHCGSSAIRDLLEFHGLNLTEAFCFGLGAGLGITYVEIPGTDTPFIVHVRSMGFEETVFSTLGVPFRWETWQDKCAAADAL
ncbi:BtrH N-terminal domain-containing protein, partial [Alcanivorax sp. HI0083]